jgi:hypothetical protein
MRPMGALPVSPPATRTDVIFRAGRVPRPHHGPPCRPDHTAALLPRATSGLALVVELGPVVTKPADARTRFNMVGQGNWTVRAALDTGLLERGTGTAWLRAAVVRVERTSVIPRGAVRYNS